MEEATGNNDYGYFGGGGPGHVSTYYNVSIILTTPNTIDKGP